MVVRFVLFGIGAMLIVYGIMPAMSPAVIDGEPDGDGCPPGMHWDIRYSECVPDDCPEGYHWEEYTLSTYGGECVPNDCPSGYHWDDARGECVQNPVFNDNGGSGGCNSTEHWDDALGRCVPNEEPCRWIFILLGFFCIFVAVFWKE